MKIRVHFNKANAVTTDLWLNRKENTSTNQGRQTFKIE